ncbi:MAG: PSD1 domain-containing protein [Planctomycetales bacterium]|nr:PSD1 domain-containing protein [Planctomycetales bacterium]
MSAIPARIIACCCLALTLVCHAISTADEQPGSLAANDITPKQRHEFEQFIRPLLETRCLECHSARADTIAGNLRLDSPSGLRRGGDLGPAIVPRNPDASLLVEAIEQRSDRISMPPDGRLTAIEIARVRDWIQQGAPDPRSEPPAAQDTPRVEPTQDQPLWALLPLADVPAATPAGIDTLLSQQCDALHLQRAPRADRRTLIRRVTYDLTGLPPTPAEVQTFLSDPAPDAYEQLIDRLLASPQYGERWGRFWLDVARYADSNGSDENIAHGNAWRYRNYVIRAFNADKPFDQFVIEQLAGDLIPDETADEQAHRDRLIATGFLSLGPKVLAEVDETKMELDIIDEQVETVGRAIMALTTGCARCHDHKFDPISQRDYYSLAGVFKSTKTMEHFTKIAKWNEVSLATPAEQRQFEQTSERIHELEALLKQLESQTTNADKPTESAKVASAAPTDASASAAETCDVDPSTPAQQIETARRQLEQLRKALPELPMAMSVQDYPEAVDLPIHIRGSHLTLGEVAPRGLPMLLAAANEPLPKIPSGHSGRLELARWLTNECQPLTSRVIANRVWRWHFGRGISASTDNFGRLGEPPWNASLLDSLAKQLIRTDWSIKALQRCIVLSETYQLASTTNEASEQIDPANQYLWRAPLRRLEAEALRDTLLFVGDQLCLDVGTSLLPVKNREFLFDHTSKDNTRYDALCRSVYLPVIRNHLYDLFQLFDYADESVMTSDRASTTVAPQALFLMNSELAAQAARQFSERIQREADTTEARIRLAYEIAFGREATWKELQQATDYVEQAAHTDSTSVRSTESATIEQFDAWTQFCQVLLASNELIYVR